MWPIFFNMIQAQISTMDNLDSFDDDFGDQNNQLDWIVHTSNMNIEIDEQPKTSEQPTFIIHKQLDQMTTLSSSNNLDNSSAIDTMELENITAIPDNLKDQSIQVSHQRINSNSI